MTTASVYYQADDPAMPDFVLINGESITCNRHSDSDLTDDRILREVDTACRKLGWKVMPGAPIVRQADGFGTVRIAPLAVAVEQPKGATARTLRSGIAHVTQNGASPDRHQSGRITVAVDGLVAYVDTFGILGSLDPAEDVAAREAVDAALASVDYVRTGPLVTSVDGQWACSADPVARLAGIPEGANPADWRDHPTIVRINDTAANALNDLSAKLGIPGDELATAWILAAAADARWRYNYFTSSGWVAPGNRIARFLPDGTAMIERETGR